MSMPISNNPSKGRLTGRKVLMIFVGFFGVMFAVNIFMAFQALSTFLGWRLAPPTPTVRISTYAAMPKRLCTGKRRLKRGGVGQGRL